MMVVQRAGTLPVKKFWGRSVLQASIRRTDNGMGGSAMAVSDSAGAVSVFDDQAVAELFSARNRNAKRQFAGYRRFNSVADALRFAIEEMPSQSLLGAYLEVEELRFDHREMRRLYDCAEFTLARRFAA